MAGQRLCEKRRWRGQAEEWVGIKGTPALEDVRKLQRARTQEGGHESQNTRRRSFNLQQKASEEEKSLTRSRQQR